MLKLYKIVPTRVNDHEYDVYDSAIVVARSPEQAKRIHPANGSLRDPWGSQSWATTPTEVTAQYLGVLAVSSSYVEGDVVLASFNAG